MKTVTVAALDPGTRNMGLAARTYVLRDGALGKRIAQFNIHISAKTPVAAAQLVVKALHPSKKTLRLIICEDFAFSMTHGLPLLGRLVGAIEFWAARHHIAFVRVGIARAKKGIGLKGNCNRKVYVAALRKRYPDAVSDDSRVALAILDVCARDVWNDSKLFTGGLDAEC